MAFVMLAFPLNFGCGRPVGGTQALPDALVRRLESSGGAAQAGAAVDEILVRGNRACGVRLTSGQEIAARRAVVASCDPRTTLERLVPAGTLPDDVARRVAGIPSNVNGRGDIKIDVALSGRLRLDRHERWRGDSVDLRAPLALVGTLDEIDRTFAAVATGETFEPMPFGGVAPTAIDPSQAPEGQDTLYLWSGWVPARPVEGADEYRARAEKSLMALAATYYDGLESLEIARRTMTTADIGRHYQQHRLAGARRLHPLPDGAAAARLGARRLPHTGRRSLPVRLGHPSRRGPVRFPRQEHRRHRPAGLQGPKAPARGCRGEGVRPGDVPGHPVGHRPAGLPCHPPYHQPEPAAPRARRLLGQQRGEGRARRRGDRRPRAARRGGHGRRGGTAATSTPTASSTRGSGRTST